MNTENKIPLRPSYPWHLFALIATTVFAIAVSLYCLNAGWFIVFQNLFYFPIIIACVYYLSKGFVFSVLLALFYLFLIFAHTSNSTIIHEAFIRVAIFIMVAGVVSFLSLKQKRAEEGKNRVQSWQEGINRILGLVLEAVPFDEKLKCITDGVVETFGADFCRIWIIGKGDLCSAGCMHAEALEGPHVCRYRDKCLCLKASSGRYTHIDGKVHRRVPFGAYKIGRIASGEEIRFLTNDVQRDPRVHDHEWAKSLGLAAFAGYQLRPTDGETLGVLALFAKFEISPDMDATLEGLSRAVSLVIQKDIAERALTESEGALIQIKKAIESSSDAIGMANPQGSHFYQNKAFLDLFEYSVAELNKPLEPVVTFADPEVGREVFTTIMQGAPWVGETIMVAKSGRRIPVFLRADAVKDDHGAIIGLIGIHTDITERKLAEEKLNNQMSFISVLLDAIPSPIFYKDTAGKYLGCNRAYEEIIGKSREEVVGKDIYELYPAEIADLYAEKDRELYEHPGSQIYDGKFNAADGKVRDVIISKATYTDTSMNVAGVVGIFIDITARKQAEQRLSEEVALKNFLLDLFKKASSLTDKDLYDYVLDYVVRITGSTIGFFHLVSDDQQNVILTAWNNEALRNCTAAYATHYPLEQAGNWVDCVRLKRPVVYNDFPISPNRKGLPEGHTPVSRFMSVPVVEGDKVRIIFGVGNKSEEYNELDAVRIQVVANDLQRIMAQRRAEIALSHSEAYFRSLIENSSDIITILNADGVVRYISHSAEHVAGLKPSEITGRNIFEYVHPDDVSAATDLFDHAVQNPGISLSAEFRLLNNDGLWHFFEIAAQNLLEDEAVKGIVINSRDITDRKEKTAEIELKSLLLDSATDSIFVMDLEGKFIYVNESAYISRGYSQDELMAINLRELDDPDYRKKIPARSKEIVEKGAAIFESAHLRKDGSVMPVEIHARLMEMKGQKLFLSIIRDISERKQAENALLNSEQKLKAVLYGSPIPQFVIDRDHRVVYWNNALEEITGVRAAEVIGTNKHWRAFYDAERHCLADLMVDGAIERIPELYQGKYGRSKLVDGAYEAADYFPTLGEEGKWLFFTAVVIKDVNGQVIGALETLEDITERKKAEEEILTLSITDQLTGLHNRRGFISFADQQLKLSDRTKRGMLLFFADLDGMKGINDTLGHEEGDRVLMEAAAILKETFRAVDIVARMGGDEFAILAIDSTEINSEIFSTRLQERIDARNQQENRRYSLSLSIGCACYDPENPCSLDELIGHADRLMYENKRIKKSCR